MREEFEKLPEISERLHTVVYNEDLNQYHAAMINSGLSVKYIQGAWYAYQEQQKKIEQLLDIIKTGLKIEHNMNNQIHSLKDKINLLEQFGQDILK